MRHPLGLLAGIIVTPLLWAGTAWSAAEIGSRLPNLDIDDPMLLASVAAMMAIGLVCGLLAGSRISPLAAFLPGAVLLGLCLWPLVDYPSMNATLPDWLAPGTLFHPLGPALAVNLALGTLLFISALAPSRWRSRPRAESDLAPFPQPVPEPAGPDRPADLSGAPQRGWNTGGHPPVHEEPWVEGAEDDAKTTTPFRRGENGVRVLDRDGIDDPAASTRTFRNGR
ncbi:hypothetical protein GCM10022205_55290 [Spinactinospora alkalitolerans]